MSRSTKKKAAIRRTKREHSDTIAERHYLTLTKKKTVCMMCGGVRQTGQDIIYRHEPRSILCPSCASTAGLKPRLSRRWEVARQKKRDCRPVAAH